MGMFDTINGEQVKCFPFVFLYDDTPSYSRGGLNSYQTGASVPYKRFHYNYGKDFTVIDINRYFDYYDDYHYIIHIIRNGKVVSTKTDAACQEDFECPVIVDYFGDFLNIHSKDELEQYIKEEKEYQDELDDIKSEWAEYFHVYRSLAEKYRQIEDKNGEQATDVHKKMDAAYEKMRQANIKNSEQVKELSNKFAKKWKPKEPEKYICFGEWLSIFQNAMTSAETEKDNSLILHACDKAAAEICKILNKNPGILSEYMDWFAENKEEREMLRKLIENAYTFK